MPVRYMHPRDYPKIEREFIEPNSSDYFIWWLFRNKCVACHKQATEINEIVPRSRSKQSVLDWKNRVTMCRECHNDYHKHGVNSKTQAELQTKRYNFLLMIGRQAYADYKPLDVLA